jgi:hypothetical protein
MKSISVKPKPNPGKSAPLFSEGQIPEKPFIVFLI